MKRHFWQVMVALAVASLTASASAFDEESTDPKYYDNAKVVRIRFAAGEGMVKRSYEEAMEEATVNLPLFENDELTTTDGRLEIYLGRLNYLRLDNDTRLRLNRLPYPRKTDLALRLEKGGIYLEIESLDFEKGIEVQTPDCGIFLLDRGVYRINARDDGRTEVSVYRGLAEVAGSDITRNVRENQQIVMANGEIERRPFYFYASDRDDFDLWNEGRNREMGYARYGSSRYLQSGYEEYESELSRSGRWEWVDEVGSYCWVPYNLESDWRPYWNGRWVWNPYYGNVWSSYDSWGWFTHYYGRWHWHNGWGWYWIPGYHWSPAWVSWFWDDYYYGWCPLSWWNTPVFVFDGRWDRHYRWHDGMPHHARSTIIIRRGQLANPHINRAALSGTELSTISPRSLAFHGQGPNDRPTVNKMTVISAAGKPVVFKQNGIVSDNRYIASRDGSRSGSTTVMKYNGKNEGKSSVGKYSSGEGRATTRVRRSDDSGGSSGSVSRRRSSDGSSSSGSSSVSRSRGSGDRSSSGSSSSGSSSSGSVSKGSSGSSGSSGSGGVAKKKDEEEDAASSRYFSGGGFASSSRPVSGGYAGSYSSYSQSGVSRSPRAAASRPAAAEQKVYGSRYSRNESTSLSVIRRLVEGDAGSGSGGYSSSSFKGSAVRRSSGPRYTAPDDPFYSSSSSTRSSTVSSGSAERHPFSPYNSSRVSGRSAGESDYASRSSSSYRGSSGISRSSGRDSSSPSGISRSGGYPGSSASTVSHSSGHVNSSHPSGSVSRSSGSSSSGGHGGIRRRD